jgi:hypothetical protein
MTAHDYDAEMCPGFVPGRTGDAGVCSCGLHWTGTMPRHTAQGRVIEDHLWVRFLARKDRQIAAVGYRETVRKGLGYGGLR